MYKKMLAMTLIFACGICFGCQKKENPKENTDVAVPQTQEDQVKVKAPEFVIASGTYTGEQILELTHDASDRVYYTLNGKEPSKEDSVYDKGIKLAPGRYTVKAVAIDQKGNQSSVVTADYDIKSLEEKSETKKTEGSFAKNIQGLWAYKDNSGIVLYEFQGDRVRIGYLQSEWFGDYVFQVENETSQTGDLVITDPNIRLMIDLGAPNDNQISMELHSESENHPKVTMLYVGASGDVTKSTEACDAIRKKLT